MPQLQQTQTTKCFIRTPLGDEQLRFDFDDERPHHELIVGQGADGLQIH